MEVVRADRLRLVPRDERDPLSSPPVALAARTGSGPDENRSGALVFENTALDMAEYDRVLIDPVLFHYHPYAASYAIEPYELTMMADYFYNAILDAVDGVYAVTDEPGPRTLRLSAAITGIKPANPARNVISEVVGQAVGLAALPSIIPLKIPLEISEAAMEAELTDSVTGERLAAIVDSRKPRNVPVLSTFDLSRYTRTGYSRNAMDYWASDLRSTLEEGRVLPVDDIPDAVEGDALSRSSVFVRNITLKLPVDLALRIDDYTRERGLPTGSPDARNRALIALVSEALDAAEAE